VIRLRGQPGVALEAGELLGPYRLETLIGEGGMGIVFRARREPSGESVALKVMKKELASDSEFRRRFDHEARAAREVQHENLVPILDVGEADGFPYLVMPFIRGTSLADRLESEGCLAVDDLVRVASEIGAGLDALHREELIHRDIKPANILIDEDGRAAVTDFGLAKGRAYTVLTEPGKVLGTLDYVAPELIRGEPASAASDVYAFGCLVFECVAGSPPFAERGVYQVAVAHLSEDPPNPLTGRTDLPSAVGSAIVQALAKDPASRPSARAYAAAIEAAVS
jgi:serine/threonine protein kinase